MSTMTTEIEKDAEAKAKADAEAKAKADEEAAKSNRDGQGDDSDDQGDDNEDDKGGSSSKKIDYQKELEIERKRREDAEKLLADRRYRSKHGKKVDEDNDDDQDDDEDDKPLTRREAAALFEKQRLESQKEGQAERVMEVAMELAESKEEAELIAEIHKNRQFPTYLTVREQVEEAHAIANRKRDASKTSELKRALKAKEGVSKDSAGTYRDGQEGTKPKLTPQDDASYKRAGFAYEPKDKVWKKKLPNGKFLIKDPRTKATYIK